MIKGITLIILGVILGLYVGVWVFLIGGIVGFIDSVKAEPINSLAIAINVAKILFSSAAGWISAFFLIIPGIVILSKSGK